MASAVTPATGQVISWNGGASTGAWATSSNWSGSVLPTATDVARFDASSANSQFSIDLGANRTVLGVDFTSAGANGFTFGSGNALTVGTSGITNHNAQTQTFAAEVRTSGNQAWSATSGNLAFSDVRLASNLTLTGASTVAVGGALTVYSGNRVLTNDLSAGLTLNDIYLSNNTNNRLLTIAGTGDTLVAGVISGAAGAAGPGRLTMAGTGTLTLTQANTYTGDTTITGGTVVLGSDSAFGTGSLVLNGNGVTLNNGNADRAIANATRMNQHTVLTGAGGFSFTDTLTVSGANRSLTVDSTGANSLNNVILSYNGNARTLFIDGTQNLTIGGVIADGDTAGGGLTMQGAGQLTLSGTNTYTGATTLSAGTLQVGSDSAFGTGTVQFGAGTLQGDGSARTVANDGTLTGNLTIAGSSDLALSGSLTLTGNRTVAITNSGLTTLGNIALSNGANNRTLTLDVSGNAALAGVVSNGGTATAGAFTKTGAGTLTLGGDNSYGGATTISAGTVVATHANALGTTAGSTSVAAGGTLALQGNITIAAESLAVTGTGRLYNVTGANTYGGAISGSGVVTVDGGTLTLSGSNSYSGVTSVNAGTLVAAGAGALGSNSAGTDVASGASLELQGNITVSSEALTVNGTGRLYNATGANTYGGAISGTGGVTVDGGELTLTATNTYSGATTVNSGTLTLGGSNLLNTATDVSLGALGTFNLAGFSQRVDGLTAVGGATVDFGAGAGANDFVFGTYNAPGSGVLVINNWEDGIDRLGSTVGGQDVSTVYFSGIGVAELDNGTTSVLGTNAYLLTAVSIGSKEWDGSSSSLWGTNNNWTNSGEPSTNQYAVFDDLGVGRASVSLNQTDTIAGIEFGTGASTSYTLSSSANEVLSLAGAVPFIRQMSASDQTVDFFQLQLGNSTVADITGTGNLTLSAPISDGGGGHALIRDGLGSGKLILSGNNTYSGGLYLNNGIVQARSSGALGTGIAVIAAGATLELDSPGTVSNNLTLTGAGVGNSGAIRNLAGTNTLSGTLTATGSTRLVAETGTTLNLTGNLTGAGTDTTFAGAGALNVSRITTGTGAVTVESGAVTFNGGNANTFTGATTVDGGSLALAKTAGVDAIGSGGLVVNPGTAVTLQQANQINDAATVTLSGTGILNLNDHTETIARLNSASTSATVALGSGHLTVGAAGPADSAFDGLITGSGASSLTVDGGGTVHLTGNSTGYAGTTTVAGGTLHLSGSDNVIGSGSASVATDATLQLAGGITLSNALTLNGTGTAGNGALENTGGDNTLGGTVALASDTTITTTTGNLSISGVISGAGNLTTAGANVLTLANTNTYTGTTTVTGGTLSIAADSNLGAAPGSPTTGHLTLDGGTLRTTANLTLAPNRGVALGAGSGTFDVAAGTTTTYGGVITGSGPLGKTGGGTLVLDGTNTNNGALTVDAGTLELNAAQSFSGNLLLNAGTVVAGHDNAFGTGNVRLANATLQGDGTSRTIGNTLRIMDDGGAIAGSSDLAFTGTTIAHGDRTLAVTNTGATTFNNLTLSNNDNNRTFTLNHSGDVVIGGVIANGGTSTSGFTKTGAGTLTFDGSSANTYTGATAVNDGTLVLDKAGVTALASGTVTVGDGSGAAGSATLRLGQSDQIADSAALVISSDGRFDVNGRTETVASLAGAGQVDLGFGALTIAGSDSTLFSGALAGDGSFTKEGSGELTLATGFVFDGTFNLEAGTLRLSDATITLATLNLTGNTTIDFSGTASTLFVTNLNLNGFTLDVVNWEDAVDFFFATNWTGAIYDTTGSAPMDQVAFTGFNSPNSTKWQGYDDQVTPVPEPSTYGALLLGVLTGLFAWRRLVRRPAR